MILWSIIARGPHFGHPSTTGTFSVRYDSKTRPIGGRSLATCWCQESCQTDPSGK